MIPEREDKYTNVQHPLNCCELGLILFKTHYHSFPTYDLLILLLRKIWNFDILVRIKDLSKKKRIKIKVLDYEF